MIVDKDGWFSPESGEPEVKRFPSERRCFIVQPPDGLCWHTTAQDSPPAGDLALADWIDKLPVPGEHPRSWHLLSTREGVGIQSVPTRFGAWHIGKDFKAVAYGCGDKRVNLNYHLVSVELENLCEVEEKPLGSKLFYRWPYQQNAAHLVDPAKLVQAPDGRWFEGFTPEQEAFAKLVVLACRARWGWERRRFEHGHFMYNAHKTDPGPVWMDQVLPRILDAVYGG